MSISCAVRPRGGLDHLEIRGAINEANAPEFRTVLLETIENSTQRLLVDIIGVDFVDAAGLGVLVGALRHGRLVNKRVDLACVDERLLKVFALTSLDHSSCIYESVQDAVQASIELHTAPVITSIKDVEVAS